MRRMNAPRRQGRRCVGSPCAPAPESSTRGAPGLRGAAVGLGPLPAGPGPLPAAETRPRRRPEAGHSRVAAAADGHRTVVDL